jgi:acyl-CoA synthetase (AMP-forming)/AMP-acid ligase II
VVYDLSKKQIVLFFESLENITTSELRLKLQPTLPKYMIPTRFIQVDQLPRNSNGKIDRNRLASELDSFLP